MVCIKHHLFPIQTHIYILSGDRLKVIGDSELDTDALQAVPQDHTYGIKIACKLMHVGCCRMPLRYNNDKQKKPLFSRGLSVCRLLFNSFSKLKIDENYKEKRRLFY